MLERKALLWAIASLLVVSGAAMLVWPHEAKATDADGDGRFQTALWVLGDSNPEFHLTPNHLKATAGTSISLDCTVEIELKDSNNVVLLTYSQNAPNGADGGSVWLEDGLAGYSTGSSFTITARYKASNGNLNDTESINFTKP